MRNTLGALLVLAVPFGLFGHLSGAWGEGLLPAAAPTAAFWTRVAAIGVGAVLVLLAYRVRTGLLGPGLAGALAFCACPVLPDAAASPFALGRLLVLVLFAATLLVLASVFGREGEERARRGFHLVAIVAITAGAIATPGAAEFGAAALGPAVLFAVAFAVLAGETALLLVRAGDAGGPARRALVGGLALVLLGSAAAGQVRGAAWKDAGAFWERAVGENPRSPAALGGLAGARADAGDLPGAVAGLGGFAEAAAGDGGRGFGEDARRLGGAGVARAAKAALGGPVAGSAEAAEAALRAAKEFAPGNVPVLVALSEARLARGDFLEPLHLLEEAVSADHAAADAWDALARARLAAGRVHEALVASQTATGLRPLEKSFVVTWADVLLTVGRGGDALEALRRALGPAPPYDPLVAKAYADAELRLARADVSAGRRGAARRKLLSAGEVDPGSGACADLLADLDRQMEEERPAALKLMEPGPDGKVLPDSWIRYAAWLCRWGEFEKAEPEFRRMLKMMGTTAAVHLVYGQWFWEERGSMEGVERAVAAYKQAIALDDQLVEAWNRLWQCQRRLGLVGEAAFSARKFLELSPRHPDAADAQQFLGGAVTDGLRGRAGLVLVVLLALAVHARALDGSFFFDDHRFITDNDRIAEVGNPARFFTDPSTQDPRKAPDIYRPLRTLAFACERAAFGLRPAAFHAVQVGLHAGCAALVYLLLIRLGLGAAAAAAGGALFAVHPAQVEAVAWISSLADVLGAFFTLLSIHAWLRSRGPDRWYAAAVLAGLLASLSKEAAIVFPGFLVLADLARPDDGGVGRVKGNLRAYVLPALLAAGLGLAVREILASGRSGRIGHIDWWGGSYPTSLLLAAKAAAYQGIFAVLPFRPSTEWYMVPSRTALDPAGILCGLAVLGALALAARAAVRGGREARLAGTGVLFFALGGLMTSHVLFTVGISRTDRFLYLSLAGGALAFAVGAERILRFRPRAGAACVAASILSMAALSFDRVGIYREEESFWMNATQGLPGSRPESRRIAIRNLEGVALIDGAAKAEGRGETANARELLARARTHFESLSGEAAEHNARWAPVVGILVDPGMEARILDNLALVRLRSGDAPGALEVLEKVGAIDPYDSRGLHLQALALRALGRIQEAGWRMEESLKHPQAGIAPAEQAQVLNDAAKARIARGLDGAALRALRKSIALVPSAKDNAVVDQVPALEAAVAERRRALSRAVDERPGDAAAASAFVLYEGRGGSPAAAREAFARLFGPVAHAPALRVLWVMATMEADDTEEGWGAAEKDYHEILALAPGDPGATLGLARCRESFGDRPGALRLYRELLAAPGLPEAVRREAEEGIRRIDR